MTSFCWLFLLTTINLSTFVETNKRIGAVFDDGGFLLEAVFNVAITAASETLKTPFETIVIKTSPGDLLEAEDAVCSLLKSNVLGVFGPVNKQSIRHIQSISDVLEIPHMINELMVTQNRHWSAVNLHPFHYAYSQLFSNMIKLKNWSKFTIIYDSCEVLPFIDNILTMQGLTSDDGLHMTLVQLTDGDDFRPQLKSIKSSGSLNYLVDCSIKNLEILLEQAQQVGLMSDLHNYIIMNPDFQTIDINSFKHGGANITGVRFFDPSLKPIQTLIKSINVKVSELSENQITDGIIEDKLSLSLVLMYDLVMLYTSALYAMQIEDGDNITCNKSKSWSFGSSIINYIRTMEMDGLSGIIKFDEEGFRSEFEIDIVELMGHGLEKVATWSTEDGYTNTRVYIPPVEIVSNDGTMTGKHFVVITAISAPYAMLKESPKKLEGNDRYEGFGIDLIDELAKLNGFNYTFKLQEDGVYGNFENGKWTGLMGEVMYGGADFAITDLTITSTRQKAVDFTSPFMNLGITILYKKPTKQPPNLFSFVSPFTFEVWGWIFGAYVGVSVLLFILGRFAPDEWQNPYPCIEEPETLDNQFTLSNAFWFTLGSILTQGSEIAPIAVSTRMTGSMWWFFTLIMSSSYTANLAAFLTVESKFYAIKSITDMSENPYGITYGAKKNGATFNFFKESDNELYKKIYQYMEAHPEYQTLTNDEGLLRVKSETEKYAFLMESTAIEYVQERNCDVAKVGGLLDNKGYGIAMKKFSPYRQPMSESILKLQEEGKITRLKEKWWKEKRGGGACTSDNEGSGETQPLVLANVGGVFIVLVAGCGLASLCAFIEMLINVWSVSKEFNVSFKEELIAELKFIFSFGGDVKQVRHRKESSSRSKSGSGEKEKSDTDTPKDKERGTSSPTSRSERSAHSRHALHNRRTSNAIQMAKMRKYSLRSGQV